MRAARGRAQRRRRRSITELDPAGRERLRRLVSNSQLAVLPTSDAVQKVVARLAPGTVGVTVLAPPGLGVDQTIAVTEVLAAQGYSVTPHIDATAVRGVRHLDEILLKLSMRAVDRVLVAESAGESARAIDWLLEEVHGRTLGPSTVGLEASSTGSPGMSVEQQAEILIGRSRWASFVSTAPAVESSSLLAWITEVKVRGLDLPIEIGVPGVAPILSVLREVPVTAVALGARNSDTYDPTGIITELADEQGLDRLEISGLRLHTCNEIDATEDWRQRIYDLAQAARSG